MSGKTATSTSTQSIPPEVLSEYNTVNANAQSVAQQPYTPYSSNPDSFVAPINAEQNAGIAGTNTAANQAQPYFGAGASMVAQGSQGVTPGQLNVGQYLSPYLSSVLGSTQAIENQQNQQQQQQLEGNAITSGAFGGDRSGVALANLAQQQGLANNASNANIMNTGYNTALGAAQQQQGVNLQAGQFNQQLLQQGGQNLANIGAGAQGAALQGASAQLGAGQTQQQTQQAGLSALYNQFLQQQSYPFQTAQFLANIAEGTGSLSGSTTSTTQPVPFFSDERLKEDIEPIGKAFDGTNIVKFRYRGSPHTQIGLIAQDVEKRHPKAVGLAAGYKTVDYDEATKQAAARGHYYAGGLARGAYAYGGGDSGPYQQGGLGAVPYSAMGLPGIVPSAQLPVRRLPPPAVPQKAPTSTVGGLVAAGQNLSSLGQGASNIGGLVPQGWRDSIDDNLNDIFSNNAVNPGLKRGGRAGFDFGGSTDDDSGADNPVPTSEDIPEQTPGRFGLQKPTIPGQPSGLGLGSQALGAAGMIGGLGSAASTMGSMASGLGSLLPLLALKRGGRAGYATDGTVIDPTDDAAQDASQDVALGLNGPGIDPNSPFTGISPPPAGGLAPPPANNNASPPPPSGTLARAHDYTQYLENKGWSPAAAAGAVGNMWQESSLRPSIPGDNGNSFGLAQFNKAAELPAFQQWAQQNGRDVADPYAQLDFLHERMQTPQYAGTFAAMNKAGDPGTAATAFMQGYERPAAVTAHVGNRINYANMAAGLNPGDVPAQGSMEAQSGSPPPGLAGGNQPQGGLSGLVGGLGGIGNWVNQNQSWLAPLGKGLATMASSQSLYPGSALLQGLGAGLADVPTVQAQQAEMATRTMGLLNNNFQLVMDPVTHQPTYFNSATGQYQTPAEVAQLKAATFSRFSGNPYMAGLGAGAPAAGPSGAGAASAGLAPPSLPAPPPPPPQPMSVPNPTAGGAPITLPANIAPAGAPVTPTTNAGTPSAPAHAKYGTASGSYDPDNQNMKYQTDQILQQYKNSDPTDPNNPLGSMQAAQNAQQRISTLDGQIQQFSAYPATKGGVLDNLIQQRQTAVTQRNQAWTQYHAVLDPQLEQFKQNTLTAQKRTSDFATTAQNDLPSETNNISNLDSLARIYQNYNTNRGSGYVADMTGYLQTFFGGIPGVQSVLNQLGAGNQQGAVDEANKIANMTADQVAQQYHLTNAGATGLISAMQQVAEPEKNVNARKDVMISTLANSLQNQAMYQAFKTDNPYQDSSSFVTDFNKNHPITQFKAQAAQLLPRFAGESDDHYNSNLQRYGLTPPSGGAPAQAAPASAPAVAVGASAAGTPSAAPAATGNNRLNWNFGTHQPSGPAQAPAATAPAPPIPVPLRNLPSVQFSPTRNAYRDPTTGAVYDATGKRLN